MAADTQALIEEQMNRKETIKALLAPFPDTVVTRSQVKEKMEGLQSMYKRFHKTHTEILELGKPDIPYIINKSGEKTLKVMEERITELSSYKVVEEALTKPSIPSKTSREEVLPKPTVASKTSKTRNEQELRIKKLKYKIDSLIYNIGSIYDDLGTVESWSKEFVEIKSKQETQKIKLFYNKAKLNKKMY